MFLSYVSAANCSHLQGATGVTTCTARYRFAPDQPPPVLRDGYLLGRVAVYAIHTDSSDARVFLAHREHLLEGRLEGFSTECYFPSTLG